MALAHFGGFSGFIPAATGQVISFIRDPKTYRINKYAQLVPTSKTVGVYHRIGLDQAVRNVNSDEFLWEDGAKRPDGHQNRLKYDTVEFQTERYNYPWTIGWKAIEQADVKLVVAHTAMAQNQLMVGRTNRAMTLLETASNWGNNTATAHDLNDGAGFWDTASSDENHPNYLAIKKSLDAVARRVALLTNGMVDNAESSVLKLLISPTLAQKMANSPEIHNYLRESPYAMDQVRGRKAGQNSIWGLPDQLYGWDIEIENAVYVNQRPNSSESIGSEAAVLGASPARKWAKSDTSAVVLSRVGGLDGQYGAPSFSTLQIYYYGKEVEIESFDEPKHRRTEGHVVEDTKCVLAAAPSGFLIQNVLSSSGL